MQKKQICGLLLCFFCAAAGACGLKASNRYYAEAVAAYDVENYAGAEDLLKKAIAKNPDKAEFYIEYGFTLIQLGRYEEALEQFSKAVLDKDIEMVQQNTKKARRGRGIAYYKLQEYGKAIEAFDQALSSPLLPQLDLDILSYKGSALELSLQLEEALEVYTEMLSVRKDAGLYHIRGDLYRKLFRYEEGLADYNQALEMGRTGFDLYFGKFAVLKELGREAEAEAVLALAATLQIEDEEERFELAKVHFYQGNYESARIEFTQLVAKAAFSEGSFFLGEIYFNQGEYSLAEQEYEKYLAAGNQPSQTLYNQMLSCALMNASYEKAADYLEKAKQLNDGSLDRQLMRNEIIYLEYTGDFQQAAERMEAYLALYEDEEAENDLIFLKTRIKEE